MEDEPVEHIKVAKVTMAFRNAEMINLLRLRGTAIKAEKWDEQKKLEDQINDLKQNNLETLTTPCSIFMTFECEEGITRALKFHECVDSLPDADKLKIWLEDQEIEIQPASEPSDIIWENRHFSDSQRLWKTLVVVIILTILLFGSFCIIYWLSAISNAALSKYPVIASCGELLEDGQTDLDSLQP